MLSRSQFLRQSLLGLAASTALVLGVQPVMVTQLYAANDKNENAHAGTFVSADASAKTFVMKDDAGAEHSHTLAADAKVTDPNGQPCKISDLKAGQKIRVTTKEGDPKTAVRVECVT